MTKYVYEVVDITADGCPEPLLWGKFRQGRVTDIIGGLEDERLVVVGYEIIEGEDG